MCDSEYIHLQTSSALLQAHWSDEGVQMKNLLEGTDYEVAAFCRDGEEAVAQYGEVLPDLVTMDIIMPGKPTGPGWV